MPNLEENIPEELKTLGAAFAPATEEDFRLIEKYDHIFVGSYAHSCDNKNRLVLPQAFRDELGDTFCIAPSFDFKSIAVYPNLMWARMRDHYEKLRKVNVKMQGYLEWLDALSFRGQECDAQGRILLPAKIRQAILKDEKDVEITGANDHIRIVARSSSEKLFEQFLADLPSMQDEIAATEKLIAYHDDGKELG